MDDNISKQLDDMTAQIGKDIAKSMRRMVEVMTPRTQQLSTKGEQPPPVEQEPLSPPDTSGVTAQQVDEASSFTEMVVPSYSTQPAFVNEPLAPPTITQPAFKTDELRVNEPTIEPGQPAFHTDELKPPQLAAFRPSPPPPVPMDRPQRFDPPVEPLTLPTTTQDLRHGFPYGHPYQADVAEAQLYDEATDDIHNVSVDQARTDRDYRRRMLELQIRTQRDANNDFRQLDDLTRQLELGRETITDVNI